MASVGNVDKRSIRSLKMATIAGLLASAIVLHVFKIPYPPATFLKFDLCGVPLTIAAFIATIEATFFGLPVFYLGIFALGGAMDPIGPAMKALAELSTYLPTVATYRRMARRGSINSKNLIILVVIAIISRVALMCLANLAITPHWLLIMRWARSWEQAWSYTLLILPHIVAFNAIAALYIVLLSAPLMRIIGTMGVAVVGEKSTRS
ncbi:MAG: hypothetical protein N3D82_01345 [Ignisphaera sp.]|nr:hypothetical protein [Ignisphaera sp.]MCX8167662.1 hypothetical protein [Ignisphaera sp.]MDW8085652.1 hypothetical protein [Ignisphaera sp.]